MNNEKNMLSDQQTELVSGGVVPGPGRKVIVRHICSRCGKEYEAPEGNTMCVECKNETKVVPHENGASGGW